MVISDAQTSIVQICPNMSKLWNYSCYVHQFQPFHAVAKVQGWPCAPLAWAVPAMLLAQTSLPSSHRSFLVPWVFPTINHTSREQMRMFEYRHSLWFMIRSAAFLYSIYSVCFGSFSTARKKTQPTGATFNWSSSSAAAPTWMESYGEASRVYFTIAKRSIVQDNNYNILWL